MKWAIAGRASANAGNIEEAVNSSEVIQACNNGIPNGQFIAHICDSKARVA